MAKHLFLPPCCDLNTMGFLSTRGHIHKQERKRKKKEKRKKDCTCHFSTS